MTNTNQVYETNPETWQLQLATTQQVFRYLASGIRLQNPSTPLPKNSRPLPRPEDIWKLLEKTKQEIRLAILQPSKDLSDQTICSLKVVSLDEDQQYEAFSYTWGRCQSHEANQAARRAVSSNSESGGWTAPTTISLCGKNHLDRYYLYQSIF